MKGDLLWGDGGADEFHFQLGHGKDVVKDFEDDIDTLVLHRDLWGGGMTRKNIVKTFATEENGDVVLDLGKVRITITITITITIEDLDDRFALINDIHITHVEPI